LKRRKQVAPFCWKPALPKRHKLHYSLPKIQAEPLWSFAVSASLEAAFRQSEKIRKVFGDQKGPIDRQAKGSAEAKAECEQQWAESGINGAAFSVHINGLYVPLKSTIRRLHSHLLLKCS